MSQGRVEMRETGTQKKCKVLPLHMYVKQKAPRKIVQWKLDDIVFTEADFKWVQHLHSNALVIIARVTNNNVHRILVYDGNVVDIIHLDTYKKMGLTKSELSSSPLDGFIGNHMVSKGTIKLAVMVGEHPWKSTVMTEFLIVDCPSEFNGIIGRPLLKVVTSIYHLTMKFPAAEGTGQAQGSEFDSGECYNKSLTLAERKKKFP